MFNYLTDIETIYVIILFVDNARVQQLNEFDIIMLSFASCYSFTVKFSLPQKSTNLLHLQHFALINICPSSKFDLITLNFDLNLNFNPHHYNPSEMKLGSLDKKHT